MHKIKIRIIKHLQYNPKSKFSSFKIEGVDSNKLSYHLRELEKGGIIIHNGDYYSLTAEGQTLLNAFNEVEGDVIKMPLIVVALIPENDKGEVLFQERAKDPWFGYWMLVAKKVRFGESLLNACKRNLKDETNLQGDFEFKGIYSLRSYLKNKLTYRVHMYCYKVTNIKGVLKEKDIQGKHKWFKSSKIKKLKVHPVDYDIYKKRNEKGWILEQEEFFDGRKLVRSKIKEIN